jgi:hypothetical protein
MGLVMLLARNATFLTAKDNSVMSHGTARNRFSKT